MTRVDLGLAAYNLLVLGVGFALLYGLGLARLHRSEWRLLGLAYLLGWALLGSVLTMLLLAGIGPGIATVTFVSAALVVVAVLVGRRVPKAKIVASRRGSALAIATAAAGAAMLVIAAGVAMLVAIRGTWLSEWDVWSFWLAKAKTIYYFNGLDTGVGGYGAQPHPEYPPLVPVMNAAASHFAGGFHPTILDVQVVLIAVAFVGGVLALIDRFVPRWLSFPLLALLAVSPGFWWRMQSMMADQTLACLVAAAAVACVIWLREPRGAWLGTALVLLVAATLTKLEGTTLGLLLVAAVLAAGFVLHGRRARPALVLLLGPAAILPWKLWLSSHGLPSSATVYDASDLLRPGFLADRMWRFNYASDWMLHSVFRMSEWLVILPLALITLVLVARRLPVVAAAVAAWIVLAFFGVATIYWIGSPDVYWYVRTSADRVVATIVIVAGTLTPLLLGIALAERRRPARPRRSGG